MFETQKVRRHDKFRKEWSQHYTNASHKWDRTRCPEEAKKKAKIMSPATLLNNVLRSGQLKKSSLISVVSTHSISTCLIANEVFQGTHSGGSSLAR